MRTAVGAVVLICGFAPPGQAQPSGPPARQAQGAAVCGWIGVQVRTLRTITESPSGVVRRIDSEPENLLMKARQDTARFCCGV
jgi:hypothetical protein